MRTGSQEEAPPLARQPSVPARVRELLTRIGRRP
jgi:hypothetical protein